MDQQGTLNSYSSSTSAPADPDSSSRLGSAPSSVATSSSTGSGGSSSVSGVVLQHGVFVPPFNDFSDPQRLVDLAVAAEERGWAGVFLWDHVLRRPEQAPTVADPWTALAAIACSTSCLRIGTMVTPLARRRVQVLARQVVTLDRLSGGRVVLGLGLGVDTSGELSRFGEIVDPVQRGDLLDEGGELLARLISGEHVHHRGKYFVADDVQLLPSALQQPRLPIWFGVRGSAAGSHLNLRPVRRAARFDGVFLTEARLDDLERVVTLVAEERARASDEGRGRFDVAMLASPEIPMADAVALGATWAMTRVHPETPAKVVEALVLDGPPG